MVALLTRAEEGLKKETLTPGNSGAGVDPFGRTFTSTGSFASANKWRFSTKLSEDDWGLIYFGYRYYQPDTSRWLSRDHLQELGGINLYSAYQNAPTVKPDPLGLNPLAAPATLALSALVAAFGITVMLSVFSNMHHTEQLWHSSTRFRHLESSPPGIEQVILNQVGRSTISDALPTDGNPSVPVPIPLPADNLTQCPDEGKAESEYGECTKAQHSALHKAYKVPCLKNFSCKFVTSCGDAVARYYLAKECYDRRKEFDDTCFPDKPVDPQTLDYGRAVNTCMDKIKKLCPDGNIP